MVYLHLEQKAIRADQYKVKNILVFLHFDHCMLSKIGHEE